LGSRRAPGETREARVSGSDELPPKPPPNPGGEPPEKVEGDPNPPERLFLSGPRSRRKELLSVFKIAWEFIHGFRNLRSVGPCVTVFVSARFQEGHPYYE